MSRAYRVDSVPACFTKCLLWENVIKHRSGIAYSLAVIGLVYTCPLPLSASNSCLSTPLSRSSAEALTADELRSLLIGNTATWSTCHGNVYHVYHAPNGTLKGKYQARYYDAGTWKITGDHELCRTWNKWKESSNRCFQVYRTDSQLYRFESDSDNFISTVDIRSGDPERLAE